MLSIELHLDGDGAWPDLADNPNVQFVKEPIGLAVLTNGMQSGKPSVALRINLPDGQIVVAETSLALLAMAARGIRARYEAEWKAAGGV